MKRAMNLRSLWHRLEQVAAWLLIPLLLLEFLSGYAILHWRMFSAILSKPAAFKLHSMIQPLTVAAFAIHGFARARRGLARRGLKSPWLDAGLALLGLGLVSLSIFLRMQG